MPCFLVFWTLSEISKHSPDGLRNRGLQVRILPGVLDLRRFEIPCVPNFEIGTHRFAPAILAVIRRLSGRPQRHHACGWWPSFCGGVPGQL